MLQALWMVRQFPRQIRRDLDRFHGRSLGNWWRGTRDAHGHLVLSSSELIDYLEFMDDEGAFKTAMRGGQWPDWKRMLAESANQQYRSLAWYLAFKSDDDHDFTFDPSDHEFVDPAVQVLLDEQRKRDAEQAAKTEPELADAGWM